MTNKEPQQLIAQIVAGALIGLGAGGAMLYGLITLSLWIMERQ